MKTVVFPGVLHKKPGENIFILLYPNTPQLAAGIRKAILY